MSPPVTVQNGFVAENMSNTLTVSVVLVAGVENVVVPDSADLYFVEAMVSFHNLFLHCFLFNIRPLPKLIALGFRLLLLNVVLVFGPLRLKRLRLNLPFFRDPMGPLERLRF